MTRAELAALLSGAELEIVAATERHAAAWIRDVFAIVRKHAASTEPDAPKPIATPSLLTVKQFAEHVGVSVRTVKQWRRDGLPVRQFGARTVRIDPAVAIPWVESRNAPAPDDFAASGDRVAAKVIARERGRRVA